MRASWKRWRKGISACNWPARNALSVRVRNTFRVQAVQTNEGIIHGISGTTSVSPSVVVADLCHLHSNRTSGGGIFYWPKPCPASAQSSRYGNGDCRDEAE